MFNCYYVIYFKGNKHLTINNKGVFQKRFSELTNTPFDDRFYNRSIRNPKFNINGYNFRCYKYKDEIKDTIPFDRPYKYESTEYRHKNHRNFNSIIYAFDIETSTYNACGRKLSIMYLGGAKGIECKPKEITIDNYKNYTTPYYTMRDYKAVDKWLFQLDEESKSKNVVTIIFIHNLSYEFSFFQNLEFVRKYFENCNLMALDTRQPFKLSCGNIEFRCSYKLTGLSLKTLGHNLGLEKLVDEKGYDVKFTPETDLPENEYLYNERDVDITLLAVISQLKSSGAFKNITDIRTLLTITGLTRAENKIISSPSVQKAYSIFCKSQTILYDTLLANGRKFYQFLQDGFLGGYVRANRYLLFKHLTQVGSIDIASSYPTQMLNRYFPYDFRICNDNLKETLLQFIKENDEYIKSKSNIIKDKVKILYWFYRSREIPFRNYFIADVELLNVKVKQFKNNNEVPLISYHKIYDNKTNDKRLYVDNGRVIQASYIRLTVTNVDLFLMSLFYDFEIKNCKALIHTDKTQKLNSYVRNSLNFYAEQKVKFKEMVKNCELYKFPSKEDFFSNKLNKYILNEEEIEQFLQMNTREKRKFLKEQLALSKSRLNAQYGINVQRIIPEEIKYNIETNEWYKEETEYRTPKTLLRNYSDGVFIVAYARLHLMIMTYLLITETDTTIAYWDTDSIKFFNDTEKVLEKVKNFNKDLERYWTISRKFNLGIFDFEGIYDNFMTGGSKCYITSKNNKIYLTVSGVPYKATEFYQRQFKRYRYNFSRLCYKYFHPNTVITSMVSNKLAMGYYLNEDNYFDCEVTDEQDNKYHFVGYSGCILCNSDFTIYGIKSMVDIIKYNRMARITNNKPNYKIQLIGKQSTEDLKLKSDFSMVGDVF